MHKEYLNSPENLKDFLMDKGIFTEKDIEDYLNKKNKEAEELRAKEEEKQKAEREAKEEVAKKEDQEIREQEKKEHEEKLKEIYPRAEEILSKQKQSNLLMFGVTIWWGVWVFFAYVQIPFEYLTFIPIVSFFIYHMHLRQRNTDLKLAKESLKRVKTQEWEWKVEGKVWE